MSYQPPPEILEKYAQVLVDFALGRGEGVKVGQVVYLQIPESAKPLLEPIQRRVLAAGGHLIVDYIPQGVARSAFELAGEDQLDFFPREYYRGLTKTMDHRLYILSEADLHELDGVDTSKIMRKRRAIGPYREWLDAKEHRGEYTWTIAGYATAAMAREAGLSLEVYWQQIIQACFLDDPDPVARWREVFTEIERVKGRLTRLRIERLHAEGPDADLWVEIGEGRRWLGGGGANIPSFEIFTSPDWRGTEGWVTFNEPFYRYGHVVEGVRLRFERGRVVEASAGSHEGLLHSIIATDAGAAGIGEFSLTDGRVSRITRFMAETLYDENRGGAQGNFHIALGSSFHEAYGGDLSGFKKSDWRGLGFNESAIHYDFVSTSPRTVTAYLPGGKKKVIYRDGKFTL